MVKLDGMTAHFIAGHLEKLHSDIQTQRMKLVANHSFDLANELAIELDTIESIRKWIVEREYRYPSPDSPIYNSQTPLPR